MKGCCEIRADVPHGQRRALTIVLGVNASMFVLELIAGLLARSTALLADSVDMLGDAVVYSFSLYVIGRGPVWQARGALLKGSIMALFAAVVLVEVLVKITRGIVPSADTIGVVGAVATAANVGCLVLLARHREDDLNMRSAWVCSRNDVIGNLAVLVAAFGVAVTSSAWPDIVVGVIIAAMFAASSAGIIRAARRDLALAAP
jgi:Co/Zn/Cd efflux system component